jgi:hypothetical protein
MGSAPPRPVVRLPVAKIAVVAFALTAVASFRPPVAAPASALDMLAFLGTDVGFSADDIRRLERGEVVSRGMATEDDGVAIAAATYMGVPAAFFLDRFRQIEHFKKTAEVQQIGRLSAAPSAADLAPLTLESGELRDARECRIGHCSFKLDAAGIDKLRATRDDAAAMMALREHLAAFASTYLRQGNTALMEYRDRSRPLAVDDQLQQVLAEFSFLRRDWPVLHTALGDFTGTLPPGLEHFVYWSKEKVAPRPVVSLTHVVIQPLRGGVAALASKQLYASHYTTGSLGLTLLVERPADAGPRTLVVYFNRTRVDVFSGLLGGVKRPLVRSRARAGAERMMTGLKTRLEGDFRRAP